MISEFCFENLLVWRLANFSNSRSRTSTEVFLLREITIRYYFH